MSVDIEAIVAAAVAEALAAANTEPSEERTTTKAGARTTKKASETAAKAKAITRKLDPIDVTTDDDDVQVRVVNANLSGPLYNGSRFTVVRGGRAAKSFTREDLDVIVENHAAIVKAIDASEKAGKVGAYLVKAEKVTA